MYSLTSYRPEKSKTKAYRSLVLLRLEKKCFLLCYFGCHFPAILPWNSRFTLVLALSYHHLGTRIHAFYRFAKNFAIPSICRVSFQLYKSAHCVVQPITVQILSSVAVTTVVGQGRCVYIREVPRNVKEFQIKFQRVSNNSLPEDSLLLL